MSRQEGLTDGDEVLRLPWLAGAKRPVVEQQPVCRLSQELQGDVALEARPDGREPGVAVAAEAVFGLLALGAVQGGGTATPGDTELLSVCTRRTTTIIPGDKDAVFE